MTSREAQEILLLYRPGTADANDPSFDEARALCERDPELRRWFENHCEVCSKLRAKFREIGAPEGLKEQILAERKVHTPGWRVGATTLAAAAMIAVIGLAYFWFRPANLTDVQAFRNDMVSTALTLYSMQLQTNDLDSIRAFFRETNAIADYAMPESLLQQAQAAGCLTFTWRGQPVSMICFHSGRPLRPGQSTDVWFFVVDQAAVPGTPPSDQRQIAFLNNRVTAATWSESGKTYVLAVLGDEAFLRQLL